MLHFTMTIYKIMYSLLYREKKFLKKPWKILYPPPLSNLAFVMHNFRLNQHWIKFGSEKLMYIISTIIFNFLRNSIDKNSIQANTEWKCSWVIRLFGIASKKIKKIIKLKILHCIWWDFSILKIFRYCEVDKNILIILYNWDFVIFWNFGFLLGYRY